MRILTLVSLRDGPLLGEFNVNFRQWYQGYRRKTGGDSDTVVRLFSFKNEAVHRFSAVEYAFDFVHTFLFG